MKIYYSGYGCNISDPERFLGKRANVMLTAVDSLNKKRPEKRFRGIHKARRQMVKT